MNVMKMSKLDNYLHKADSGDTFAVTLIIVYIETNV